MIIGPNAPTRAGEWQLWLRWVRRGPALGSPSSQQLGDTDGNYMEWDYVQVEYSGISPVRTLLTLSGQSVQGSVTAQGRNESHVQVEFLGNSVPQPHANTLRQPTGSFSLGLS